MTMSSGPAATAERAHAERRPPIGDDEQAEPQVDAERERRERTGERDVAQRVGGEDGGAQHHEVADEAGRERDRGAGQQGVLHEGLTKHERASGFRPRSRRRRTR